MLDRRTIETVRQLAVSHLRLYGSLYDFPTDLCEITEGLGINLLPVHPPNGFRYTGSAHFTSNGFRLIVVNAALPPEQWN